MQNFTQLIIFMHILLFIITIWLKVCHSQGRQHYFSFVNNISPIGVKYSDFNPVGKRKRNVTKNATYSVKDNFGEGVNFK
jgi:hypothetical protein